MKFAYIRAHRKLFDIGAMCAVFGVTPAGFHDWNTRLDSPRTLRVTDLAAQISVVHHEVKGVYGSIKVTRALALRHTKVNRKTVAKLMLRLGIRSKVSRKFRVHTTDSNHQNLIAPNTLDQKFASAAAPNQVWGVDITYIHTGEGFLDLASIMDFSAARSWGGA